MAFPLKYQASIVHSSVTIANIPGLNTIIDTRATGAPPMEGGGQPKKFFICNEVFNWILESWNFFEPGSYFLFTMLHKLNRFNPSSDFSNTKTEFKFPQLHLHNPPLPPNCNKRFLIKVWYNQFKLAVAWKEYATVQHSVNSRIHIINFIFTNVFRTKVEGYI